MFDAKMVLRRVMRDVKALNAMEEACLSLGNALVFVECWRGTKWEQRVGCERGLKEMQDCGGIVREDGMGRRGAVKSVRHCLQCLQGVVEKVEMKVSAVK